MNVMCSDFINTEKTSIGNYIISSLRYKLIGRRRLRIDRRYIGLATSTIVWLPQNLARARPLYFRFIFL